MEENLRGLAVGLRPECETDEDAFARVKASRYLITYRHDEYWPFYHVEYVFGRMILTINTAHSFFTELYEPLVKAAVLEVAEGDASDPSLAPAPRGPSVVLELILLSLARAQILMGQENQDAARIFDAFRRKWSESFRIQMSH